MASSGLTFQQLEKLWVRAGGDPTAAPTAAAIALAESTGNPQALNNTPATGDYSVGLWQINYFGSLGPPRTQQFGPPQKLTNPLANARAAVAISDNGQDFSPWSTYTGGAYLNFLGGSGGSSLYQQPPRPGSAQELSFGSDVTGLFGGLLSGGEQFIAPGLSFLPGGLTSGFTGAVDAVKLFAWLMHPKHWAMIFEVLIGSGLLLLGFKWLGESGESSDVSIKDLNPLLLIPALRAKRAATGARKAKQAEGVRRQQHRERLEGERVKQATARTRKVRAEARSAGHGANEAKRRAERARGITSSEIAQLQMGKKRPRVAA